MIQLRGRIYNELSYVIKDPTVGNLFVHDFIPMFKIQKLWSLQFLFFGFCRNSRKFPKKTPFWGKIVDSILHQMGNRYLRNFSGIPSTIFFWRRLIWCSGETWIIHLTFTNPNVPKLSSVFNVNQWRMNIHWDSYRIKRSSISYDSKNGWIQSSCCVLNEWLKPMRKSWW